MAISRGHPSSNIVPGERGDLRHGGLAEWRGAASDAGMGGKMSQMYRSIIKKYQKSIVIIPSP